MRSPDPARRIQWLLWGASAIATAIFLLDIAVSLNADLHALHHERTWWEALWFWMQVVSPIAAQFLLLPAFRRRGLLLPAACMFLSVLLPGGFHVPAFVAAALLGTRSKAWSLPIALGSQVVGTALGLAVSPFPWRWADWWTELPYLIYTVTAVLLGILLTNHQELTEARVARARSQERARISREMHDSLAQRISLISLHAAALASRRDLDEEQAARTAGTIRTMAAEAGHELRQILHVLHDDGSGDEAAVAWADVAHIIDQHREAGLEIQLSTDPDWERAFDRAGAAVCHAVLRTVEEALANARRHGSQGSAQLSFETTGSALVVQCANPASTPALPLPGHGLGLPGLRERMRLLGGRLSLAREAGVFTLRAELPAGRKPKKEPLHD
ncbi:sensor histidine kinase [Actinomyces massiliensis]|uniref:sensor histidine kinase n=1 Tax=Actinomyces massiliensis TaxID=461393 RepID=UPI00037BEB22|nr:histidine kinase [Actinomyces massiliensis]